MENIKFYKFGSKNSLDEDYLVEYPDATGTEKDLAIISAIKSKNPQMQNWDMNIIKIADGKIVFSIPSKGNPDSVHNSLLRTYHLHDQVFPCPLTMPVERNINAAIEKCIDYVLTFYKKTDQEFYKNVARPALKSREIKSKVEILKSIDFNILKLPNDINEKLTSLKKISFYICQTIALLDNIEIYTKDELISRFPELEDVILRRPLNSYSILNDKLHLLQKRIESLITEKKIE